MQHKPPFTSLSLVYDEIMADIEYEAWGDFILSTITDRGWQGGAFLDLGCGTGNGTFPMVVRGFEVSGLDASAEMLQVAREKLPHVKFYQGDFTCFTLPERFSVIYSVFDSINNLLGEEAFQAMSERVFAHLEGGGFFVFDVNTTIGLRNLWGSGRAEGSSGDVYYCWVHSFDEASGLAKVEAYCQKGSTAFTEVHYERPYDAPELHTLLTKAGFYPVEVLEFPHGEPAGPEADRVWVVAQKPVNG
ncbi:MAG: methyltransferase domain-containing protein [Trueperaceae bacterium]|nr:MAG: methyltransferase domain-containing protein [Trueperaceae bacterium]